MIMIGSSNPVATPWIILIAPWTEVTMIYEFIIHHHPRCLSSLLVFVVGLPCRCPSFCLLSLSSIIVFVHHCCHPSFSLFDVHYCCHLHRRCSGLSLLSLSASSIISIITCVHLRPRPVGGDSSPPGFHPDTLAPPPPKEDQLVIGVIIVFFSNH